MLTETYTIGRNIRLARDEKDMSQRELAEKAQMSQTQLSDYENDKKEPGLYSLARIAKALNKSIDELFYGNSNISFITSAPDKATVIVNCFVELWNQGTINAYHSKNYLADNLNKIILNGDVHPIKRLMENLDEFERNKETYPKPNEYLEYVKQSIVNQINNDKKYY